MLLSVKAGFGFGVVIYRSRPKIISQMNGPKVLGCLGLFGVKRGSFE